MRKVTPEILKQMKASGKPIIRITLEELNNAKFVSDEKTKKIYLKK